MTSEEFLSHLYDQYPYLWKKRPTVGHPDFMLAVEAGWHGLIEEALERYDAVLRKHDAVGKYRVHQVKEKMGSLRLYIRPLSSFSPSGELNAEMSAIREEIEERSYHVCEVCGHPGEWGVVQGYYLTRCPTHLAEYKKRRGV